MSDFAPHLPGMVEQLEWPRHVEEAGRSAVFSDCRAYRYGLFRIWDPARPPAMFIGLNPSTADELSDDPTVRKCVRYARDWGHGGLIMANLFAYRSTDPDALPEGPAAVGPDNDQWLTRLRERAGFAVAAWGAHKAATPRRVGHVLNLLDQLGDLYVLRLTDKGSPHHPLYLPGATRPRRWEIAR